MTENLELDFSHRPPFVSGDEVEGVCAFLRGKGWIKAREIEEQIQIDDRRMRVIAERSEGRIWSGQKGCWFYDQDTPLDDATHAANWLISQGKKMIRRGMAIRRRGFALGKFRRPAA
jgi:hypothetical protein